MHVWRAAPGCIGRPISTLLQLLQTLRMKVATVPHARPERNPPEGIGIKGIGPGRERRPGVVLG